MRVSDRIQRWRNPAQWRDDHPEACDGESLDTHECPDSVRLYDTDGGGRRAFPGLVPDEADELAAEIAKKKQQPSDR